MKGIAADAGRVGGRERGSHRGPFWNLLAGQLSGERIRFVALRYGAALLAAAEALAFARLLGPESYGRYAFVIQTAAVLVFAGAGSGSGYVFAFYRERDDRLEETYLAGALAQFLAGTAAITALLAWWNPDLAFSGVLLLIMSPYLVTEPLLRVRNEFSVPVAGKALGSVATLAVAVACAVAGAGRIGFGWALAAALAGNATGFGGYYIWLIRRKEDLLGWRKIRAALGRPGWARQYLDRVLRPGLPLNIASVVFLACTYADRFFVERFRPSEELSVYSLAWQLVQGSVLLLTSLNLISGVRVGERMAKPAESLGPEMGRQLKFTAAAGGLALALLAAGSWLLERTVYQDYQGLVGMTLTIGAGYLAVNTARAVSSVLFYARRNLELTIAHGLVLAASIGGNLLALRLGLPYYAPVGLTSLALIGLSVWLLYYSRMVAREMGGSVPHAAAA